MYGSEGSELTLAMAGDAILTRRWSTCEVSGFRDLLEPVRAADAAYANFEVLLHDYEVSPAETSGGTYMRAPPWVADELTRAGFDLFSAATNHVGDYSHGGMRRTMAELDERDVVYAGLGEDLAEARAPAYLDTGAGRLGLVAACSSMTPESAAGEQGTHVKGRPGLSPLRLDPRYVLPEGKLDLVRELSDLLNLDEARASRMSFRADEYLPDEDDDRFHFLDPGGGYLDNKLVFEAGDDPGFRFEPDESDREAILARIRDADRQADWIIASLHTHEGEHGRINDASIPPFLESFARDCVHAGADVFVAHGPHVLRGIEVYDGAPIFYSLGNLVFQLETIPFFPVEQYTGSPYDLAADALPSDLLDARMYDEADDPDGVLGNEGYWESAFPVCRFSDGELESITLHPMDLGRDEPSPRRGLPVRATGETAERIIADLAELSEPYGTDVEFDDGVGRVVR